MLYENRGLFLFCFLDEETLNSLSVFLFSRIRVRLPGGKVSYLYPYFIIFKWFSLWVLKEKNQKGGDKFPMLHSHPDGFRETVVRAPYLSLEFSSARSGLTPAYQWEMFSRSSVSSVSIKSTVALELINFYVYRSPWWKMTHCAVWEDMWWNIILPAMEHGQKM